MNEKKHLRDFRPKRLKHLSIRAMAPSIITVLALSAGATAIRFAIEGRFEEAMVAVLIAAILDGLDGGIARLLKVASKFGAELDSLSDVISFGVAPAIILYSWNLAPLKGPGWILALAFIVSCGLRLARFNSKLDDDDEPRRKAGFLTGIPAPVGAILGLMPIMLAIETDVALFKTPAFLVVWTALVALGMVSRLPTYAFRTIKIRRDLMIPLLIFVALLASSAQAFGWWPLILMGFSYIVTLPVGAYRFYTVYRPADHSAG